jgi:hypothetical protein
MMPKHFQLVTGICIFFCSWQISPGFDNEYTFNIKVTAIEIEEIQLDNSQ